jgi:hypothetical protein
MQCRDVARGFHQASGCRAVQSSFLYSVHHTEYGVCVCDILDANLCPCPSSGARSGERAFKWNGQKCPGVRHLRKQPFTGGAGCRNRGLFAAAEGRLEVERSRRGPSRSDSCGPGSNSHHRASTAGRLPRFKVMIVRAWVSPNAKDGQRWTLAVIPEC